MLGSKAFYAYLLQGCCNGHSFHTAETVFSLVCACCAAAFLSTMAQASSVVLLSLMAFMKMLANKPTVARPSMTNQMRRTESEKATRIADRRGSGMSLMVGIAEYASAAPPGSADEAAAGRR